MKEGFTIKSAAVAQEELDALSAFARRELSPEEIYVFSVVLCDNEIDRDGERFTLSALQVLSELFVGKTGIFDHSMKGRDQTARIFSARVEKVDGKQTAAGEEYHRLVARAYMPRLAKNEDLITEIETGIKKEVSVGCAVGRVTCSVCGADLKQKSCSHIKGRMYSVNGAKVRCHALLEEPHDAYEWSFVAVPAQPLAGVTKSFASGKEEVSLEQLFKALKTGEDIHLSAETAAKLHDHIEELQKEAAYGRAYRSNLCKDVVRLCTLAEPRLSSEFIGGLTGKMTMEELQTFKALYEAKAQEIMPLKPQLHTAGKGKAAQEHSEFKI